MNPENDTMSDETDMLQDLFDKQMALNRRIGVNPPEMDDEEKIKWILNYTRATSQELAELIDSVPWKWWAKYQEFDVQNAKVEDVDLFHFLISLAQVLGMDAKDVHDLYNQKNKLNFKRQDDGYATKDESDNRSLG
jgi:dimeric dUTPase (all-alpha-NTP-PPase superfamily)